MNTYDVKVIGKDHVDWDQVDTLDINHYPWYERGLKQDTQVKMVLHRDVIKIKAHCEDIHSYSRETKLNGDVYLDSCFEFFVTPEDNLGGPYFNVEMNCCGVLHMSYKDGTGHTTYCTKDQEERITITTSIQSPTKDECPDDSSWDIDLTLPLEVLEEISQKKIEGDTWYGNFYRCGGKTEDQYATWNPIAWEKPNFHLPSQFGKLTLKG